MNNDESQETLPWGEGSIGSPSEDNSCQWCWGRGYHAHVEGKKRDEITYKCMACDSSGESDHSSPEIPEGKYAHLMSAAEQMKCGVICRTKSKKFNAEVRIWRNGEILRGKEDEPLAQIRFGPNPDKKEFERQHPGWVLTYDGCEWQPTFKGRD